ncbi:MAG: hypothetical protein MK101_01470 [Phycisphaerales bacterium]|nr:hypothetical protein [Phycisphaerales bacterium]
MRLIALLTGLLMATQASAQQVRVGSFHVAWRQADPILPPLDDAWTAPFRLSAEAQGWTAAEPGRPAIRTDLKALSQQGTALLDGPALKAIRKAISDQLAADGLLGVDVQVLTPAGATSGPRAIWFVLDLPLDGAGKNDDIPASLVQVLGPRPKPPAPKPPPKPAPKPEPTPAPEPSPAPEPEVVPAPEPAPEPSPAPEPEVVPAPEPAPEPSPTPEPEVVPAPEPAPTPEPEVVPAPKPAPTPEPTPVPTVEPSADTSNFWYQVHPFEVAYEPPHPQLPQVEIWMDVPFVLAKVAQGWTAPAPGLDLHQLTLRTLNESPPAAFSDRALLTIATAIADVLLQDGLQGVSVAPDPRQIVTLGPDAGEDLRGGNSMLRLVIRVGRVTEVRTIAAGDRVPEEERINHPIHTHVLEDSPIQVTDEDEAAGPGGLIYGQRLQDYLHFLSRHPTRSVEASVAAASQPGGVALDYIITESRPWTAWYRFGNDGTRSEGYLRQQFGFHNAQLTGNDDVLTILYATSNFRNTNAVNGSYELPIGFDGRLRARVSGSWSQYFADQFGVTVVPDAFSGISWSGSGDLRANLFQDGPLFIDAIGGVRYQFVNVNNTSIPGLAMSEQAGFVIPYGMLNLERVGAWSNLQASLGVEGNVTSHDDLSGLGRFDPADRWARMNWSATASTFLEPMLDPDAWRDPSTPESSTLAHEISLRFGGQWSMGSRLLPQFQQVVGGPVSNRGYPVSMVAGDSGILLSAEYRFHLPRALAPNPEPGELFGEPFRASRQYVFGRPDWDLVPLAFVDASWLFQQGDQAFENNNSLISVGIGLEAVFKRNIRARLDWGWALSDVYGASPGGRTVIYESGNNRLYATITIYF